ncbi:AAA family ATPase [Prochlorococcus sp. AH-716-C14]|nr:AAA family ATPase [Prochlorococcus sp. AH-716-C14]
MLKDKAVIQSIDEDSKAFDELVDCAVYLIETKIPIIQRAGIIRNQAKMLSMPLSSKDVFSIMAKARRDIQGIDKGEEPNVELDVPEECWLWEDLIAEGTLNLVVSMPKVGKSSLIGAFLGQLSSEFTEFLGKEIIGKKRSIYICGTDQPINDWIKILIPSGLAERTESGKVILKEPLKRLWHKGKPIHLTEEEIELLYDVAVDDPNSIFVFDAFASLISGLGLDENHAASVEPVRMLCEALAPTKATVILLHHASSTNAGERAVKASRGTKALPAEASQIIDLDWLIPEDKNDNRIKVSTAGRNSTPVDMVIEQVDRAVWVDHGSSSEIAETLRLEQVRAKLSERQELVLTFIEEREQTFKGLFVTSQDLVENFEEEFQGSKVKALATLNQLEKKKLIHGKPKNFEGKGLVKIFYLSTK